jgi:hypothetical protein
VPIPVLPGVHYSRTFLTRWKNTVEKTQKIPQFSLRKREKIVRFFGASDGYFFLAETSMNPSCEILIAYDCVELRSIATHQLMTVM